MNSRLLVAIACVTLASVAWAECAIAKKGAEPLPVSSGWLALPDSRLAQMCGGFSLPSGLVISFGIERAVFVNGQLVATTQLQINDPARLTPSTAARLAEFDGKVLVQVGAGNTVHSQDSAGLVIQNSADHQAIRTLTRLDVSVSTLSTFKLANIEASLQNALVNAALSP